MEPQRNCRLTHSPTHSFTHSFSKCYCHLDGGRAQPLHGTPSYRYSNGNSPVKILNNIFVMVMQIMSINGPTEELQTN